jgi:hypothetical protein
MRIRSYLTLVLLTAWASIQAIAHDDEVALPKYDTAALCKYTGQVSSHDARTGAHVEQGCLRTEAESYDSLTKAWRFVPENKRKLCIEQSHVYNDPSSWGSYDVLISCLELEGGASADTEAANRNWLELLKPPETLTHQPPSSND